MAKEQRVVKMYTRERDPGATTGNAIVLEIDGVEIPYVMSIEPHEITPDGVVMATVTLAVRLGK